MKVLIVCSGNSGSISPFIKDQAESIVKENINVEYFLIRGRGPWGYFKNLKSLKEKIKYYKPDIIHAHYGLSGLLAGLQRKVPIVLTLHGSDVNIPYLRLFSLFASLLAKETIIVSNNLASKLYFIKAHIIPCGVDFSIFRPMDRSTFRRKFNFKENHFYVLFSSRFDNRVKNFALSKKAISFTNNSNIELVELKGYSRQEVAELMNAVDLCLLTSFSEGSPQFTKEAIACGCPVVSVDVGDVKEQILNIDNCHVVPAEPSLIAEKINNIVQNSLRLKITKDFERYDNKIIAKRIIDLYKSVSKRNFL